MAQQAIPLQLDTSNPIFYPINYGGTTVFASAGTPVQPRLLWFENVIPTEDGLKSLTYDDHIYAEAPTTPFVNNVRSLIPVESLTGEDGWYFQTITSGVRYHYVWTNNLWKTVFTETATAFNTYVSTAKVNGVDYFYTTTAKLFSFGSQFGGRVVQTPLGLNLTSIIGITRALDYLIMYSKDTIYWSTPGTPLDFRPIVSDVVTGAGSSKVQDIKGDITRVLGISGGFIIYTSENIVAARFSGNSSSPWLFSEIRGGGGISGADVQEVIGTGNSSASHFAFTKSGMQEINLTSANSIFPALSDFLASEKFTINNHDGTFSEGRIFGDVRTTGDKKLVVVSFVSDRYVCISYGDGSRTSYNTRLLKGVWIFDTLLKSWGHLVMDHIYIYDYSDPRFVTDDKVGILGVWKPDGSSYIVRLSSSGRPGRFDFTLPGELIYGEFQLTQRKTCTINEIDFSGDLESSDDLQVHVRTKYDVGYIEDEKLFIEYPPRSGHFVGDNEGKTHKIRVTGVFNLSSISVTTVSRGY